MTHFSQREALILKAGSEPIPFICYMRMKKPELILSKNSMELAEAVMHCQGQMILIQTMMEKVCFLQEVLMGIHIRQFYYPGIKLQTE